VSGSETRSAPNSFPDSDMPLLSNKKRPGSSDSLEAEVRELAASGDGESWVFIVPNRIAQRRMERDFLEAARGRTLPQLNILTLADLAGKLATTALPDFRVIGDGESAVLIELSIRELLQAHKLSFFEREAGDSLDAEDDRSNDRAFPIPRGTFELVVNTIRQLKESGVTTEDIQRDLIKSQAKGETTEVRRARDIVRIYEAYQNRLIEHRLMDTQGQMLLANVRYESTPPAGERNYIQQDFQKAFPKAAEIFISGFYYLEPPSIKLIARLAEIEGISIRIELEEDKNNRDLFAGLIDLEAKLLEHGFHTVKQSPKNGNPISDTIGRHLFRSNDAGSAAPQPAGRAIQYVEATDAANEVEEIARRIKLLSHSDADIRKDLSQIVVATPSSEAYTPLIEEIFRRHGIPVQIADR